MAAFVWYMAGHWHTRVKGTGAPPPSPHCSEPSPCKDTPVGTDSILIVLPGLALGLLLFPSPTPYISTCGLHESWSQIDFSLNPNSASYSVRSWAIYLTSRRGNLLICKIVMIVFLLIVSQIKGISYMQRCAKPEVVNTQKKKKKPKNVPFFPFPSQSLPSFTLWTNQ